MSSSGRRQGASRKQSGSRGQRNERGNGPKRSGGPKSSGSGRSRSNSGGYKGRSGGSGGKRRDSSRNSRDDNRGDARSDSRGYKGKRGGGYEGKHRTDDRGDDRRTPRSNRRDGAPRTSNEGEHAPRRGEPSKSNARAEQSGWGSVAKHGAIGATIGQRNDEIEAAENERFNAEERAKFEKRQAKRDAKAARQDDLRTQAQRAIDRGAMEPYERNAVGKKPVVERRPLPGRPPNPRDITKEMTRLAGKQKGADSWRLFKRAAKEYQDDRFDDCLRTIKPLAKRFAEIVEVQELFGLCLYRLGRWDEAIEELEGFRDRSGTTEQNPVLMDCHRAVGNWADVDELWSELGEHSPSPELMAEGRIVMAGAYGDRGQYGDAIRLLEKGWKPPRQPEVHHLRRAYVLADFLERDGKIPKSRKLFGWIASKDASYLDAGERARS